jgi:hypothetical protein
MTEKFVEGTQPVTDDRAFYTSCGIQLRAPFPELQTDFNKWASSAAAGGQGYGRYSWTICGFAKPSTSPTATPQPTTPPRTAKPTPTPRPTRKR